MRLEEKDKPTTRSSKNFFQNGTVENWILSAVTAAPKRLTSLNLMVA